MPDLPLHRPGRAEGAHKGEIFGIAATHRHVTVTGVNSNRFVDGRVVEARGFGRCAIVR
jgi:predicted ester cyclase